MGLAWISRMAKLGFQELVHCSLLGLPTGAAECLDFLHGETGISDFMRGKSGFQELVHHQYCSSLLGLALISSMVKLGFQELVHHCSSLLGAAACLDFETLISGSPLLQRQPDILAFMRGETWISGVGAPPSWCTMELLLSTSCMVYLRSQEPGSGGVAAASCSAYFKGVDSVRDLGQRFCL